MPLFRWDGAKETILPLFGSMKGQDFIVACPGPSLKKVDPAALQGPGVAVITVNTAYPYLSRPDIWLGMDSPGCYARELVNEPFLKIFGSLYMDDQWDGRFLRDYPNTVFATGAAGPPWEMFKRLNPDGHFLWIKNTMWVAIHLAAWLGAKRIGLVGVDLGGVTDYHDGRMLDAPHKERNRQMMRESLLAFPEVVAAALDAGVRIVSCTEGSPINQVMPYLPIADFIGDRKGQSIILDGNDAELLRTRPPEAPMGVMTGADASQEWLLPWWWAWYSATNQYPVAFADFGMSPKMREWCSTVGRIVDLEWQRRSPTWFRKPFAMCNTPFRRTLWLDADCQVHNNLLAMFREIPDDGRVYVAPDKADCFSPIHPDWVPVNSGILGYVHDSKTVRDWAREIVKPRTQYHGDQGALNEVLHDVGSFKTIFGGVSLRLDPAPDPIITHWTGPEGKEIIRSQIAQAAGARSSRPLVSILMPARNAATYIREAIISTLSQTYANLELVIVDDASTDGTLKIAMAAEAGDKRVRVFHHNYPLGYPAAFNLALRECRGDIIARMDADDTQPQTRIEAQVMGMMQTRSDAITCTHTDCDAMNRMKPTREVVGIAQELNYVRKWADGKFNESKAPHCPTIVAWRRVYEAAGEFDPVAYGPDTRWNFRALERGVKFAHVLEPLYLYRKHNEQMTELTLGDGMPVCVRAAQDSLAGRFHPAIFNGDWLDPDYRMAFDKPVNIYVNTLPKRRPEARAFHVYLGISEPADLRSSAVDVLAADWLDLAITIDPEVLAKWPTKAVKMTFGGSWLGLPPAPGRQRFGLSFLCGFKQDRPGHKLRREIWKRQEELYIPHKFWISGRGGPAPVDEGNEVFPDSVPGIQPCDKWGLFDTHQFNLAIESASENDYFTEKLIDCFLTRTVPVYWGCPNIGDYFNTAGMIQFTDAEDFFAKMKVLPPNAYAGFAEAVEHNYKRAQEYARPLCARLQEVIAPRVKEGRPLSVTTTATAEYWQRQAPAVYEQHGERQADPEGWDIVKMATSMLRDCEKVVDWGCGTGRYAHGFHPEPYTGVDINRAALETARRDNPGYRFVEGEVFPQSDGYLFMTVFLHMPDEDVDRILRQAKAAGAQTIVMGEILGREWRRDGEPAVWNRELAEYEALFAKYGYVLGDIFTKGCKRYMDDPAWSGMKNRNVHLLRFDFPSDDDRTSLAKELGEASVAVEVGVWEGVFSKALLDGGKGMVYSVDPWAKLPEGEYADFQEDTDADWEARYRRVRGLLLSYGNRNVLWRKTSEEAEQEIKDGVCDLVYLDANHRYVSIAADIARWWPKVKPGGILAGHDFTTNAKCGVELAVNEFCAEQKLPPTFLHGCGPLTWIVRKPCPA